MLSASTWNTLGLGVAVSLAGLGSMTWLLPHRAAETFGFNAALKDQGARAEVPGLMSLAAARDLSLATAMIVLGVAGQNREMGVVLLSTMVVCGWDTYVVWRNNKRRE